jgi:hypothetical protein
MLMETPGKLITIPKVHDMFASRACRSSIMNGSSLKHETMWKMVTDLSKLDQPWNFPHGLFIILIIILYFYFLLYILYYNIVSTMIIFNTSCHYAFNKLF